MLKTLNSEEQQSIYNLLKSFNIENQMLAFHLIDNCKPPNVFITCVWFGGTECPLDYIIRDSATVVKALSPEKESELIDKMCIYNK